MNKTTKQQQKSTTTTKPKPATRKRNQTTEKRSQYQPDIKMFLAKKNLEIETRAAAIVQPTQVQIKFSQPSQDATSALKAR